MPNGSAHIRSCYCMRETGNVEFFFRYFIKPRVIHVFIRFDGSGPIKQRINFFVKSCASRWTGRCFDKVLCLVNSDDKNLDS